MELMLIDFESLTVPFKGFNRNDPAVCCSDVQGELTAFSYLWWQILWIAFIWHYQGLIGENPPYSRDFVRYLFDDSYRGDDASVYDYRKEFNNATRLGCAIARFYSLQEIYLAVF
jgi:hypothetical protein